MVKLSLSEFVSKHFPSASLDCIDEIVLSYMVGVLEDCSDDGLRPGDFDTLDIDGLMETLAAYIPDFGRVGTDTVGQWLLTLSTALANQRSEYGMSMGTVSGESCDVQLSRQLDDSVQLATSSASTSKTDSNNLHVEQCRHGDVTSATRLSSRQSSETRDYTKNGYQSETRVSDQSNCQIRQEVFSTLQEMFPGTCSAELLHCYSAAQGVADQAIQLLLARQETGQSLTDSSQSDPARRRQQRVVLDDAALKQQLLDKYSYQDVDDANKHHRPQLPKSSPKKMVRYLDSKVVSVKGERFTEIKRPETDEMKKTYVNLKPQRQYRFH